ncbi:MAG: Omp28-related outer membrane protein [Bacteroidales bacterium]|jgi:hypothetical protein|nr:Omp28-related outer membrane protein [Bacteroidales bacterium]
MKKFLSLLLFLISCVMIFAQTPTIVSTTPSNKNIVLEEYTGIHCTYCPDGHKRANQLAAANPGRVVVINIHQGEYAAPGPGEPDFRTSFGNALASQIALTGYPTGTVNRRNFSSLAEGGSTTRLALSRGDWAAAANIVKVEPSVVNVAASATIDVVTRELTVLVEAYYTGEYSLSNFNFLNVAVLQDNIFGPQTGASSYYPAMIFNGQYKHNHMLRHLLTGQWGDTISGNGSKIPSGTFYSKVCTYQLPDHINNIPLELVDLKIAAFVAEGHKNIITGVEIIPTLENLPALDALLSSYKLTRTACSGDVTETIKVKNLGSTPITSITFDISTGEDSTQFIWNNSTGIAFYATQTITLPVLNLNQTTAHSVTVTINKLNEDTLDIPLQVSENIAAQPVGQGTVTLNLWCDRYGEETTWNVKNSSGTTVASGGPYTQLSTNTTSLKTVVLTNVTTDDCYLFTINDSFGDGINCGFGAGHLEIKDGNNTILVQNDGTFTTGYSQYFKYSTEIIESPSSNIISVENSNVKANAAQTNSSKAGTFEPFDCTVYNSNLVTIGISDNNNNNNISIFPNPSTGLVNIVTNENSNVKVIDITGKIIDTFKVNAMETTTFTQSAGMYFIEIESNGKISNHKIVIQ